ncbi:MAG: DUF1016 family protein [Leptolyngbya sp. SIO1E4]|nr:DUF1016 family protein [Leptolyngbya sp. SIO1E4]
MPHKSSAPASDGQNYAALLDGLKTRVRTARVKAALAVNQELVMLYWHIGREILARQLEQGWGAKVIDRLAQDLKREFPDMKGFSRSNLKYMRAFAEAWPDEQFVQQLVGQIPWGHNCTLLNKVKEPDVRCWYIQQTIEHGWSRTILEAQIETGLYQRERGVATNFESTLPPLQSELAKQVLKDPYNFELLTIARNAQDQDLKRALVKHMCDFLLELGVGFSLARSNYHIEVGGTDFYVDMLFYHLKLYCFVAIQLEMGEFQPQHSGQMNFYLMAIDDRERQEHDQPTIGIILCKSRNKTIAEYALGNLRNPISVATHQLPEALQDELPSPEQLQAELDSAVQMIEANRNNQG